MSPTVEQVSATRARIGQHFKGDEAERAVKSLQAYRRRFTGHAFETLADPNPDALTANDLVTVSTLSAAIRPDAAIVLLEPGMQRRISGLLRNIPDVPIWNPNADLSSTSFAQELWSVLTAVPKVGRVRASKLMAAKRPSLIPIYDQYVAASLNFGDLNYWVLMQKALRDMTLGEQVRSVAAAADAVHLSVLRTIDIVVWMREYGFTKLTDSMKTVGYDAPLTRSADARAV